MKKQEYFDIWFQSKLTPSQIEGVLCHVLNISKTELFLLQEISVKYMYDIQKLFYKVQLWIPEEYVLQTSSFYGRDFFVDARVLIPRTDSEVLVKRAVHNIHLGIDTENTVYVDIGTGSGCIPVSIVSEISPLKFFKNYALDISLEALEVAQKNIDFLVFGKIQTLHSNLMQSLFFLPELYEKQLFISANLPYIKENDTENMDTSVVKYEPHVALFWGKKTGFELYETLIKQCFQLKHVQSLKSVDLFIEIGFDQYEISKNFLKEMGLLFEYFPDSANIYRVIHITGF